jgi:hypothetical protein
MDTRTQDHPYPVQRDLIPEEAQILHGARGHAGEVVAALISQLRLIQKPNLITGEDEDFQQRPLRVLEMHHGA